MWLCSRQKARTILQHNGPNHLGLWSLNMPGFLKMACQCGGCSCCVPTAALAVHSLVRLCKPAGCVWSAVLSHSGRSSCTSFSRGTVRPPELKVRSHQLIQTHLGWFLDSSG